MSARFEELDRQATAMGEISLRRRLEPTLQVDVFEAKLDDEFLMSSLFTAAEIALAHLGMAALGRGAADAPDQAGSRRGDGRDDSRGRGHGGGVGRVHGRDSHGDSGDESGGATPPVPGVDVVVGGLGLGYTAAAVLEHPDVRSLRVIEALPQVIDWHRRHLLPVSAALTGDARCELVEADFFATVAAGSPFGPDAPERVHAVLVDIDHTPDHLLHPSHGGFYTARGLERVAARLHPGGVFGLWSDDPPDDGFGAVLAQVFASSGAEVVTFPNFYTGGDASNTVYLATT